MLSVGRFFFGIAMKEIFSRLYLLFQILRLKARMDEEVSRMVQQMQLCVLGKDLAEDDNFLDICRGFQVENHHPCYKIWLVGSSADQRGWGGIGWEGRGGHHNICPSGFLG